MAAVAGRSSNAVIRSAAAAVQASLSAALLGQTSTPTADDGLTIYFPGPLNPGEDPSARVSEVTGAYADHAAFDAVTGWSAFLRNFVTRPQSISRTGRRRSGPFPPLPVRSPRARTSASRPAP